jgi:ABC-2 type transport system permease protein
LDTIKINTINELYKFRFKRGMKLYFLLVGLLPFLIILTSEKMITNDMLVMPTASLSFSLLEGMILVLIPLFTFITLADLFSGEWEKGTLFAARPTGRLEVFVAKIVAVGITMAFQLILFYVSTALSVLLFHNGFQAGDLITLLFSTMISWFPLMALTIFTAFLTQFFKSSGVSVGISMVVYLLMFVLPFVMPRTVYVFPTAYLDWYELWKENVSIGWSLSSSLYLFSFSSLFFASGYYMFNKKEI